MFALVRHGAYQGYPDHLSKEGQESVKKLAKQLQSLGPWTSIRTSPKLRTQETANILSKILNLPVIIDETLLEDGDASRWFPPNTPDGTLLVTHAPTIRRIATRWMNALDLPDYRPLNLSTALLINPDQRTCRTVDLDNERGIR